MTAGVNPDASKSDIFQRPDINFSRNQKNISQLPVQLRIIGVQGFLCHIKDFPDKRKSVAVHPGGCQPDQGISRFQLRSRNHILLVYNSDSKACQIVLVLRIKSGHLGRLASDQGSPRLTASVCDALDNFRDLLRIVLPTGDIIQKEKRLSPGAGNVIDAHGHTVDTDRIVLIHQESQLQLCSHAVCSGNKRGLFHVLKAFHGKSTGKSAETAQHFGAGRCFHILFHQFHGLISGLNIYSCISVIHNFLPFTVLTRSADHILLSILCKVEMIQVS